MKKNSFMEGAIIATLAIIFSKIIGVLYVIPFYSIIGEKGGALYGYAYNIYNIFLIISSAGIPLAISKITSEYESLGKIEEKNEMFKIARKVIYCFSIFSFLICFLFAKPLASLIIGDLTGGNTISDVTFVIRCVSFALLVVPLLSISRGYLQGHKYISASSLSQVIEQIVRIIIILIGSSIALKVLKVPLVYAVGVSVFAATIGAIVAYIYLYFKLKRINPENKESSKMLSSVNKKEIIKKIIGYSIPFIIINIANSLYNTTDMILIIRGLNMIGTYTATEIETISSIFTTWGSKLISIVNSFATGLVISLIPSLVSAYTLKKQDEVNKYFNKTLQVLLFIILPLTIFMSIFAEQIWMLFYGKSTFGPIIFKYTIIVAFFDSAYIMICSALQGLYKTKLIYTSVILGLLVNILLDIPLMLLFNKLNIYPFYGAITATVCGYLVSLGIPLISLNKKDNFNYASTLKLIPKLFASIIILVAICIGLKYVLPVCTTRFGTILYLGGVGIVSATIYFILNKKRLVNILGKRKVKKEN